MTVSDNRFSTFFIVYGRKRLCRFDLGSVANMDSIDDARRVMIDL
jgi:hypothetical protein